MLRELPTWTGGTLTVSNTPVKHSRTPGGAERGAAKPGEHSREVLGTAGFLEAELDDLEARGVIRTEPADAG
jgi:crotonobetainyl-CoA:carnitine CoA-transferase CaiB-like acyl-CoA transferase